MNKPSDKARMEQPMEMINWRPLRVENDQINHGLDQRHLWAGASAILARFCARFQGHVEIVVTWIDCPVLSEDSLLWPTGLSLSLSLSLSLKWFRRQR